LRQIDFRDIALLADLLEGSHINKLNAIVLKDFKLDRGRNSISRRLSRLESYGYVSRGFLLNQANTYFITPEGVKFLKEAMN